MCMHIYTHTQNTPIGFDFIWSEKHPIGFDAIWRTKHPIGFDFIWSEKHPIGFDAIWRMKHPNWIWLHSFEGRNIQLDLMPFVGWNTQIGFDFIHLKWETYNWVLRHLKCETPNWICTLFEVRNIQLDFYFVWSEKHPIGYYVIWSAKHPNWIWFHFEVRNIQLEISRHLKC
jgi:hypothetical protein